MKAISMTPSMPSEPIKKAAGPRQALVFIDGQNLFHRAKTLFGHWQPDFDIRSLSSGVCQRMGWAASEAYFYSGMPTLEESPHWHRFWQQKLGRIQAQKGIPVHTFTPELRYHNAWTQRSDGEWRVYRSAQEKGVDVRLALDMVAAAYERRCDAMVVMTEDSDLQQAVDRCHEIAAAQGRTLSIANAMPHDPLSGSPRRALAQTTPVRIDQAFYEQHTEAAQARYVSASRPQISPASGAQGVGQSTEAFDRARLALQAAQKHEAHSPSSGHGHSSEQRPRPFQ